MLETNVGPSKDFLDLCFAYLVVTLGIEVDFVDRPTAGKNLNVMHLQLGSKICALPQRLADAAKTSRSTQLSMISRVAGSGLCPVLQTRFFTRRVSYAKKTVSSLAHLVVKSRHPELKVL